jgi:protein MAK16
MWEKIPLHPTFLKALEQVNKYFEFWPHFIRKKIKQRMTKIRQYLIRMRRMRNKVQPELIALNKTKERIETKREKKAHAAAHLQDSIRGELLQRLRQGTYGELYDDIVNFNQQVYNEALDDIDEEEFDIEDDVDEFVEAYSEDEEEDAEVEYEHEYEMETEPKQKMSVSAGKRKFTPPADEEDIEDSFEFDSEEEEEEAPAPAPAPKSSFSARAKARTAKKGKHVAVSYDDSE